MRGLIPNYAQNDDDRVTLAIICDRVNSGKNPASRFLNPREREMAAAFLRKNEVGCEFYGGYEKAERTVCIIEDGNDADGCICAVRVSWRGNTPLTHRDLLGALLALGIKRFFLGDILVGEGSADVLVIRDNADFICSNLTEVGRERVTVEPIALAEICRPEDKIREIRDTVASLRLDAVLGSAFSLSRSDAADMIRSGRVSVNHSPCENISKALKQGDFLSVRGAGRAELAIVGNTTRKGRISITVNKFI